MCMCMCVCTVHTLLGCYILGSGVRRAELSQPRAPRRSAIPCQMYVNFRLNIARTRAVVIHRQCAAATAGQSASIIEHAKMSMRAPNHEAKPLSVREKTN